jgi:nucleoside phosphorylase
MILVCFAVKEEAKPFREVAGSTDGLEVLVTGMGAKNAANAVRRAIEKRKPALVLTCGFAGGLRPGLESGAVLFSADGAKDLEGALTAAGARRGKFYCAQKVATTVAEKAALWTEKGADAVEMESEIVCFVCNEYDIPAAIVRVILDTAEEELPLDFNELMNERQEMSYGKLAVSLVKSPGKIGALRRLQAQSQTAAEELAKVLLKVVKGVP